MDYAHENFTFKNLGIYIYIRLLTKWYFRKQISKIPFFINVKSIYTTKKSKKQHIPMLSLLSI